MHTCLFRNSITYSSYIVIIILESKTQKTNAVRMISITDEWSATYDVAFARIKSQLTSAVKLAHPKRDHTNVSFHGRIGHKLCRNTLTSARRLKASTNRSSGPFTSVIYLRRFLGELNKLVSPRERMICNRLSMKRLDYLISRHTVFIFTNHANLVYIYVYAQPWYLLTNGNQSHALGDQTKRISIHHRTPSRLSKRMG